MSIICALACAFASVCARANTHALYYTRQTECTHASMSAQRYENADSMPEQGADTLHTIVLPLM